MNEVSAVALALAETLLREVIQRDDAVRDGLKPLDGTVLLLELQGPDVSIVMEVIGTSVTLDAVPARTPHVRISGTPSAFVRLLGTHRDGARGAGDVEIQGNLGVAQSWQHWLRQLDCDWEEWLAGIVGDVAAHQLARAARACREFARTTGATLGRDVSEYLREESGLLPGKPRVEEQFAAIDELAIGVDRAAARLERLIAITRGR